MAKGNKTQPLENNDNENLTKEQAWNVLSFANALYNGVQGNGFYDPFLLNQTMVGLNNDPLKPTYDRILKALENSPSQAETLCRYSDFMEVFDTIYGKTLRYLDSLLSYDLHWTCRNIKNPEIEYNSSEYKDDLRRVYKFLDSFDYKQEFKKMTYEMLRKETVYTFFRDSHNINDEIDIDNDEVKTKKNEKFALQIMPQKYCKLDGYFNSSQLLYSFDMDYFLQAGTDIDLFDSSFKRKYNEVFSGKDKPYNPAAQLDNRNGTFATWTQLNPNDGAYAFKFNVGNFSQTPPLASLMKAVFNNTFIDELQLDKDIASAYALLVGEIKTFNNAKSGTQSNQFVISPEVLGGLMNIVAKGLKKNIKNIALPLTDPKFAQFTDNSPLMPQYQYKNGAAQGASSSSLIYSTDKPSQFELEQQIEFDFNFVAQAVYEQYANFLNFFVNKKTRKYKFNFEFGGCNRLFYKKKQQDAFVTMADRGFVLNTSAVASIFGFKPHSFDRMLEESKYGDMSTKLQMLMNRNTMSSSDIQSQSQSGGSNKETEVTDLTESGAVAREYD